MEKERREIHVSVARERDGNHPMAVTALKDGSSACKGMSRRHVSVGASWSIRIGGEVVVGRKTLVAAIGFLLSFSLLLPTFVVWLRSLESQVQQLRSEVELLKESIKQNHVLFDNEELLSEHILDPSVLNESDDMRVNTSNNINVLRTRRATPTKKAGSELKYFEGKWLHPCPKNLAAKHFQGKSAQYFSREGYLYAWTEDFWCTETKSPKIQYDSTSGGLVVTETGVYIFYAQLTFVQFNQAAEFRIYVNSTTSHHRRELGRCRLRSPADEADTTLPFSCSTTLLVCLNKQDKIFLTQPIRGILLEMNATSSFMGLVRLNRIRRCPTYTSV